jgi:hypothetical protein
MINFVVLLFAEPGSSDMVGLTKLYRRNHHQVLSQIANLNILSKGFLALSYCKQNFYILAKLYWLLVRKGCGIKLGLHDEG